jgi:hypothetical protein
VKLSRVVLKHPRRIAGTLMTAPKATITEDDVATEEGKPGSMVYDAEKGSLVFGNGNGINWDLVEEWEALDLGLVCPDCGKEGFRSDKALHGHKAKCSKLKAT